MQSHSSQNLFPYFYLTSYINEKKPMNMDLREVGGGGAQTGLILLRIGTGGGLLCIR
jgi:hypothetical protein